MRRLSLTLIRPFRALRPAPGRAAEILAPPYDVLSSAEARQRAEGKPWSFLHISKPEIDLDPAIDPHDQAVYAKAANLTPYQLSATDSASWGQVTGLCLGIRQFARAAYAAGPTLTTERMVAAMRTVNQTIIETGPLAKTNAYFQWPNVTPDRATTIGLNYPCPLPKPTTGVCWMPQDSPLRFRTVKY